MSILVKPQTITKGVEATFSLSKSELLSHPSVASDPYFSDSLNWNRINIVFKSSEGGQYEIVEFDAQQSTPAGKFLISEKARSLFEVLNVEILDFDGGFLKIPRSELNASEFDIDLT